MRKKILLLLIVTTLITLHEPTIANAAEYPQGSVFWAPGKFHYMNDNWETITYTNRPEFTFQFKPSYTGSHWIETYNTIDNGGSPIIHMKYNNPSDQPSDFYTDPKEPGEEWQYIGNAGSAVNLKKGVTVTFRITPNVYRNEDIPTPGKPWTYHEQWHHYHGFGCDWKLVTYNEPETSTIQADFAYDPVHPTTLDTLSVVATSKSDALITSYMWFINGIRSPDIQQKSSWTYPNPPPGELEIALHISDKQGKTSSITKTITITDVGPPEVTPKILMIPEQPTTDTPIQFYDSSSIIGVNIQSRSWYFNGEYLDTVDIPVLTWDEPTPGTHTVTLELFDGENVYTKDKTFTVTENTPPQTPTLNIRLEAKADGKTGTKFWAGQKVYLLGSVNKDNPQPDQQITIIIKSDNQQLTRYTTTTDIHGVFAKNVIFPNLHNNPEKTSSKTTQTVKILVENQDTPFTQDYEITSPRLDLKTLHLVQAVELPDEEPVLAAGKTMGIRVIISVPALKNQNPAPEIDVPVQIQITGDETKTIEKIGKINGELGNIDLIYTPMQGKHNIKAIIDPTKKSLKATLPETYLETLEKTRTAVFKSMKPLSVKLMAFDLPLTYSPEDQAKLAEFYSKRTHFIEQVYPLPKTRIRVSTDLTIHDTNNLPGGAGRYKTPYLNQFSILKSLTLRSLLEDNYILGILPKTNTWFGPSEDGVFIKMWWRSGTASYIPEKVGIVAHELGHIAGIYRWLEQYDKEPVTKYVGGLRLDEELIFKDNTIYDISKSKDKIQAFGSDKLIQCFMGDNTHHTWVSPEAYKLLIDKLKYDPDPPLAILRGVVLKNSTVIWEPLYTKMGYPDEVDPGPYTLKMISGNNQVLHSLSFGNASLEGDTHYAFASLIPEGTSKIQILEENKLLSELRKTTPPSLQVTLEETEDTMTLDIHATDPDTDKLYFSILYSYDGGETWDLVTSDETQTRYIFKKSILPGGEHCVFKVMVTDGFSTVEKWTDYFYIEDRHPEIVVLKPQDSVSGEDVVLEGYGIDYEDGVINSLIWVSDLDGRLGEGPRVIAKNLTTGTHTLTVSTVDTGGNQGIIQTTFTYTGTTSTGLDKLTDYSSIILGFLVVAGITLVGSKVIRRGKQDQPPVCPSCGEPATWIQEYERWYCYKCEEYL